MPSRMRASAKAEQEKLIALYLQAETDIINEIGRLRSMGNVDYHAQAALDRVQRTLYSLENEAWKYVPKMIEREFYVNHPESRRIPETVEKHAAGYASAAALTAEQHAVIGLLVTNLMGEITEANATALRGLENALLGRTEADPLRRVGLEWTARMEARGAGAYKILPGFVEALRRDGVTCFVDRAGRKWSLHTYGTMVLRTTSRQASNLAVLTADPNQDLYQISSHATSCPLCAPYEGRVYSKSGTDPDFPPLAAAFGKMDAAGPDTLANTWLNIHPNCLHVLLPWTDAGRTPEEIQAIKDFSSPEKNPFDRDPRTQEQIEAYRRKEQGRRKWLADYRQWERYRVTLGDKCPRSFQTFLRHKQAGDEKYQKWLEEYRQANFLAKYGKVRYHEDGTVVVTDTWTIHRSIPAIYRPNAVIETQFPSRQVDRIFYDEDGKMVLQIHSGDHGFPKRHPFGQHGEHQHQITWDESHMTVQPGKELEEKVWFENRDILGDD